MVDDRVAHGHVLGDDGVQNRVAEPHRVALAHLCLALGLETGREVVELRIVGVGCEEGLHVAGIVSVELGLDNGLRSGHLGGRDWSCPRKADQGKHEEDGAEIGSHVLAPWWCWCPGREGSDRPHFSPSMRYRSDSLRV